MAILVWFLLHIEGSLTNALPYMNRLIAPSSGPYCNEQPKTSFTNLKDSFIYNYPVKNRHFFYRKLGAEAEMPQIAKVTCFTL